MVIHASRCLLLASAIAACGPENSDTTADDTTDSSGTTTTTQPTSGSTADTEPTPADCVPDEPTDPHALTCAKRGEADCDGPLDELTKCKWITTTIHDPNATTCEAAKPGATCVALRYYGDGCNVSICGEETLDGSVYFRTTNSCEIEVSVDRFCGDDVVGWNTCTLDGTDTGAPPSSPPDPAACKCAC